MTVYWFCACGWVCASWRHAIALIYFTECKEVAFSMGSLVWEREREKEFSHYVIQNDVQFGAFDRLMQVWCSYRCDFRLVIVLHNRRQAFLFERICSWSQACVAVDGKRRMRALSRVFKPSKSKQKEPTRRPRIWSLICMLKLASM